MDIVHRRSEEDVKRLLTLLSEIQAQYRHDPRTLSPQHELDGPGAPSSTTTLGDLDLLGALVGDETYDDLLATSEVLQLVEGLKIRVVTLPEQIALERRTRRAKDIAVLPAWKRR